MITDHDLVDRLHSARDAAMQVAPTAAATTSVGHLTVAESTHTPASPRLLRGRRLAIGLVGGGLAAAAVAAAMTVASGPGAPRASTPVAAAADQSAAGAYTHVTVADASGLEQEVWIPADPVRGTWMLHVPARASFPDVRQTAVCAQFAYFARAEVNGVAATQPGCDTSGGWDIYRPPFAASLPDDPAAVITSLRGADHDTNDASVFARGAGFAENVMTPPEVATKVLTALKTLPGTSVTHGVANAGGTRGDAISYTGQIKPGVDQTFTVIVDPTTGEVVGSADSWSGHAPDLTTITRTSVTAIGANT